MDATRALLDELMGKDRNLPPAERKGAGLKFSDHSVCKYDLVGLCPNSLFKNTRSDLGPCAYEVHADHLDWERLQARCRRRRHPYFSWPPPKQSRRCAPPALSLIHI